MGQFTFLNVCVCVCVCVYVQNMYFPHCTLMLKRLREIIVMCCLEGEQLPLCIWLETHRMCWLKEIYGRQRIYQVHTWGSRTGFIQPSYHLYHKTTGLCLISLIQLLNWNNVFDLKYVMHVLSVFSGKGYFKRDYKSQCHMLCWQETTIEILTQPQNTMLL